MASVPRRGRNSTGRVGAAAGAAFGMLGPRADGGAEPGRAGRSPGSVGAGAGSAFGRPYFAIGMERRRRGGAASGMLPSALE